MNEKRERADEHERHQELSRERRSRKGWEAENGKMHVGKREQDMRKRTLQGAGAKDFRGL
eukprot:280255-Pleurochrysis_carterae.AAC.2